MGIPGEPGRPPEWFQTEASDRPHGPPLRTTQIPISTPELPQKLSAKAPKIPEALSESPTDSPRESHIHSTKDT